MRQEAERETLDNVCKFFDEGTSFTCFRCCRSFSHSISIEIVFSVKGV